jgi:hypothetical protein
LHRLDQRVKVYQGKLITGEMSDETFPEIGSGAGVASVFLFWRGGK